MCAQYIVGVYLNHLNISSTLDVTMYIQQALALKIKQNTCNAQKQNKKITLAKDEDASLLLSFKV